jgi:TolB-like protein/Flp pilus assembly protein TadD
MIQHFFAELRRRKVLRVAGMYAVAGWGILQVAEKLFPMLMLPPWTVTFVAVLLLIAFPLTLIVAWAFELTPEGVRRTTVADDTPVSTSWLDFALFGALLLVIGLSIGQFANRDAAPATTATPPTASATSTAVPASSVAVLPFTSFSDDEESNYFADGLTEELINNLAQVSALKVSGRTSVFYFKNRNEDLREIGQKLGVANVLEGSVRRSGDQLRITVQLVSTADGFHLWSQTYDRKMDDVFAIQDDVSRNVASVLETKLVAPIGAESPRTTHDGEAVRKLLVAKALARDAGPDQLHQARRLLDEVIAREPDNVEALALLAQTTMHLSAAYLQMDFDQAMRESIEATDRALSLAPSSVAANLAAGFVYTAIAHRTDEQRFRREAERVLSRAERLAPNDPDVLTAYGTWLKASGRHAEALDVLQRAVFRDPLALHAQFELAGALMSLGRFAEARETLETLISVHPELVGPRLELGEMLMAQGQLVEALPLVRADHLARTSPRASFALANIYLNLGLEDAAKTTISEMTYAPLTEPLGRVVLLHIEGAFAGSFALALGELERTRDAIWRPLVIALALDLGDLATAREHLQRLEPTVLAPNPDVAHTDPQVALAAANLLSREGNSVAAAKILEQVLALNAPPASGYDPADRKITRAKAYAQLGKYDRATEELRAAKIQGFRSLWNFDDFLRLDRSPSFAGLREDPRFLAFVSEIEADNARMRQRVLGGKLSEDAG